MLSLLPPCGLNKFFSPVLQTLDPTSRRLHEHSVFCLNSLLVGLPDASNSCSSPASSNTRRGLSRPLAATPTRARNLNSYRSSVPKSSARASDARNLQRKVHCVRALFARVATIADNYGSDVFSSDAASLVLLTYPYSCVSSLRFCASTPP